MSAGTEAGAERVAVSLVIPVRDEAEGIAAVLGEAERALGRICGRYEIIVVDDGSRDGTPEVVGRMMAELGWVRLVRLGGRRGYGAALRAGFLAARFPLVAFTDGDGQFDLADLARLLGAAEGAEIVCGYRVRRQDRWHRRFLSWGYGRLIAWLLGLAVRDCDCAMKLYRREALRQVLPASDDYFANAEMLWKARQRGLTVVEVPVRHRPRQFGRSKVSVLDVPRTLTTLLPFWWSLWSKGRAGAIDRAGPTLAAGGRQPTARAAQRPFASSASQLPWRRASTAAKRLPLALWRRRPAARPPKAA